MQNQEGQLSAYFNNPGERIDDDHVSSQNGSDGKWMDFGRILKTKLTDF